MTREVDDFADAKCSANFMKAKKNIAMFVNDTLGSLDITNREEQLAILCHVIGSRAEAFCEETKAPGAEVFKSIMVNILSHSGRDLFKGREIEISVSEKGCDHEDCSDDDRKDLKSALLAMVRNMSPANQVNHAGGALAAIASDWQKTTGDSHGDTITKAVEAFLASYKEIAKVDPMDVVKKSILDRIKKP